MRDNERVSVPEQNRPAPAGPDRTTVVIQFGSFRLEGWPAGLVLLSILLLTAARIAYRPPSLTKNWPLLVSVAGWLVFIIYWQIAAKNSAPSKSRESHRSRQIHQLLLNGGLLLVLIPVVGLRSRFLPASSYLVAAGLGVQAASGLLAVWARRHLGANWSGEISIKMEHQLIRTGPYRLIRHPIYTGMLGMFAGTALVLGELHALIGFALAMAAYVRKIRLEESNLVQAFGPEYHEYLRKTWALLPGLF